MTTSVPRATRRDEAAVALAAAEELYHRELAGAVALETVADAYERNHVVVSRDLRRRAKAIRSAASRAYNRALDMHDRDTRGCWAHRPYKAGTLVQPGPAHIVSTALRSSVQDDVHVTLCGRRLVGDRIAIGPPADGDVPHGWSRPCRECLRAWRQIHPHPLVGAA